MEATTNPRHKLAQISLTVFCLESLIRSRFTLLTGNDLVATLNIKARATAAALSIGTASSNLEAPILIGRPSIRWPKGCQLPFRPALFGSAVADTSTVPLDDIRSRIQLELLTEMD